MEPANSDRPEAGMSRVELLQRGGILTAGLIASAGLLGSSGIALAAGKGQPVKKIEDLYTAWQKCLNSGDLQGLLALYDKSATYVNGEGATLTGAAIGADYQALIDLNPKIQIGNRKHVVSGDIALTTNQWKMSIEPTKGKRENLTGGGIEVAHRGDNGGWLFVIDDASRMAVPAS